MPVKNAVVFGAGRIARGFVGNLLGLEGYGITFVDVSAKLVDDLNARRQYSVHILGAPEKSSTVHNVSALLPTSDELAARVGQADIMFVSVGGANLPTVGATIAEAIAPRLQGTSRPLNIVVCENWRKAGETLRSAIETELVAHGIPFPAAIIGVSESTIMRSAVDATDEQLLNDPLAVQSQNYWSLPIDADALVEGMPTIQFLDPVHNFQNALERKLYTYNTGNATISYLGWIKGFNLLSEAANDPEIVEIANGVYTEMGAAMIKKHGFDAEDQLEYASKSLRKFQDTAIVDPLVRQIRDPFRKLSRNDRLVGAAMFALDAGIEPRNVAIGIAAALRYRDPEDAAAVKVAALVDALGVGGALVQIAGIEADSALIGLVESKMPYIDALVTAHNR